MAVLVAREARPEGGYVARITIDNEAKLNTINRVLAAALATGWTGPELVWSGHDSEKRAPALVKSLDVV